jgi:hypothetical protein
MAELFTIGISALASQPFSQLINYLRPALAVAQGTIAKPAEPQ